MASVLAKSLDDVHNDIHVGGLAGILQDDSKAKVELFLEGGEKLVRKTLKPWYGINMSAEWFCEREVKALERLLGLQGTQQIVARDYKGSFVSEYVEGTSLRRASIIPYDYFDNLRQVLADMHRRGVADLDFGNSCDLIIDPIGDPVVIDFGAAIVHDKSKGVKDAMMKPFFDYVCKANHLYLLKRKYRYAPEHMNSVEIEQLNHIGNLAKMWQAFRYARRHIKYDLLGMEK